MRDGTALEGIADFIGRAKHEAFIDPSIKLTTEQWDPDTYFVLPSASAVLIYPLFVSPPSPPSASPSPPPRRPLAPATVVVVMLRWDVRTLAPAAVVVVTALGRTYIVVVAHRYAVVVHSYVIAARYYPSDASSSLPYWHDIVVVEARTLLAV
ncbi:hypothetical protein BKA62DRAFT_777432 [Auriculariales sp. MPI-PUGE-AT-0066]|nr:hypothetical protein BKA62DRAFT_777432 [Auriculariales sp. MPI-PUGE-AT-0066]